MHPYLLLPLTACLVCTAFGSAVLAQDPSLRGNRLNGAIILGAAFWALCEVLWNAADDPTTSLVFVHLSALGWVGFGPFAADLMLSAAGEPHPRLRRAVPWLYAGAGVWLLLAWFTPLLWESVVRVPWGWSPEPGPLLPVFLAFTAGCAGIAGAAAARVLHAAPGSGERRQAPWILFGLGLVTLTASTTDVLLPLAGLHVPRLGTSSFILICAIGFWLLGRYGYFMITPGVFSREVLEGMPAGVALLGLDGRIRNANPALARLTVREPAALLGVPARELLSAWPDEPGHEVQGVECELRASGGRRVPVSMSTRVVHDRGGHTVALLLVVHDLREVMNLRKGLVTSGRLAAVGELAAGIAHEINNPMAYVRANLGELGSHWETLAAAATRDAAREVELKELVDDGRELLADSLEGVERTCSIVREIKGLSAAGRGETERADLNTLVDSVLRVAGPQVRFLAAIEKDYAPLPLVRCDPQELKQVFLNLLVNAAQAVEDGGRIRVCTMAEDGWVQVAVEDDGCGIPESHLERIFDPFFTTKAAGEGTGLGLSLSYEIVRRHGGRIDVESQCGEGTRFVVWLPAAAGGGAAG